MDLLEKKVSPLLGSVYYVDMTSLSSSSSSSDSNHVSSSAESAPFLIAQSRQARVLDGAEYLGFACLIGDGGQSLVPSAPILSKLKVAQQNQDKEQYQGGEEHEEEKPNPKHSIKFLNRIIPF